jgi:hypothetical protein
VKSILISVFSLALLSTMVLGQVSAPASNPSNPEQDSLSPTSEESRLLNNPNYTFQDVLAGKKEAVQDMQRIFPLLTTPNVKQRVASILVSIGVKDEIYSNYLRSEAKAAVDNPLPYPYLYPEKGKNSYNPAFIKYCKQHHLAADEAVWKAQYEIPGPVFHLAAAGDPRSFKFLVKTLKAQNYMIAIQASKGLAKINNKRAIKPIVRRVSKVPLDIAGAMSEALVYFDDPAAQATADQYISKDRLVLLRKNAKEKGVKAMYGY